MGDTRSLDYSSYGVINVCGVLARSPSFLGGVSHHIPYCSVSKAVTTADRYLQKSLNPKS